MSVHVAGEFGALCQQLTIPNLLVRGKHLCKVDNVNTSQCKVNIIYLVIYLLFLVFPSDLIQCCNSACVWIYLNVIAIANEMSKWINEFAGKAEDILNNIDMNATRMFEQTEEIAEDVVQDVSTEIEKEEQEGHNKRLHLIEENKEDDVVSTRIQLLDQQVHIKSSQLKESEAEVERLHLQIDGHIKDHEDYRLKAHKILAEKDKIISELKSGCPQRPEDESFKGEEEMRQIKHERDFFHDEANRLSRHLEQANLQINEVESRANRERTAFETTSYEKDKTLEEEKQKRISSERESENKLEDIQLLENLISCEQASYLKSIETRDVEIERMRKQLVRQESDLSSSSHQSTLLSADNRIKDLTSALVQRQTVISSLQSDKTYLALQIEKLEKELMENKTGSKNKIGRYYSSHHDISHVYVESPFESGVTRNVKKAYSSIHGFSVWLGILFRRYPMFRIGIIFYGIFLHLWVFTVLFHNVPDMNK